MRYGLFADVLEQIAATVSSIPQDGVSYDHLKQAVRAWPRRLRSGNEAIRANRRSVTVGKCAFENVPSDSSARLLKDGRPLRRVPGRRNR